MEWLIDIDDFKDEYCYVNYLFGLYLGYIFLLIIIFELINVVKVVLEYCGDGVIGWSMGWKLN